MSNATAAIGELVRRDAAGGFEGYWNNPEAQSDRLRGGWFWSGDLAYRDDDGVFWFAGRVGDWLRVDSENFAISPVESILGRFARRGGGRRRRGARSAGRRPDSGSHRAPAGPLLRSGRVRGLSGRPVGPRHQVGTSVRPRHAGDSGVGQGKIDKKPLRREAWLCEDPVWWRPARSSAYVPMTDADRDRLRDEFLAHGRIDAYPDRRH